MGRRGIVGAVAAIVLLVMALVAPAAAQAFGPVGSFGSDGEGAGQLSAPGAIAVGPDGNFFVADNGNDRVDVFAPGGVFLYAFGKGVRPGGGDVCDALSGCRSGVGGDAAGALERPEGIAVSSAGDVYVAEEGNERVSAFTTAGAFRFAFGYHVGPESANVCTAVTSCHAGSNLRAPEIPGLFTQIGPEGALSEPTGVAIDSSGKIFVVEEGNNRVSVFSPLGEFLYMFGLEVEGKAPFANVCTVECIEGFGVFVAGAMERPSAIATMPGDLLAISDSGNHRLDVFAEDGKFVRAIGHEVRPQLEPPEPPLDPSELNVCSAETGCIAGSGKGAGSLRAPAGLAVSPSGAITVGDVELERVSQFDPSGKFVRAFGAGVATGTEAFEVCTALTGCQAGVGGTSVAGATPFPFGVAEACGGAIFVAESTTGLARVERFGEPGSTQVFCPPPEKSEPKDPELPGQPSPPGDSAPPAQTAPAAPSNAFVLGTTKRDRRRGTARVAVTVPGAGLLTIGGPGIHRVARTLAAAATVSLPVRLVGDPRQDLLADGRRKVRLTITFTPSGGTARTETRKLTLVKQPPPRPRRQG